MSSISYDVVIGQYLFGKEIFLGIAFRAMYIKYFSKPLCLRVDLISFGGRR